MRTQVRTRTGRAGAGCLIAFAVPLVAIGLFALLAGLRKLLGASPDPSEAWGLVLFGLVFAGAGAGILLSGLKTRRAEAEKARLREVHPAEPWLQRPDWASGRIQARTTAGAVFLLVIAVFWNPVSTFATIALWKELLKAENKAVWLVSSEDMIRIGAYVRGSHPETDYAIEMIDKLNHFLRQPVETGCSVEDAASSLEELVS